MAKTEKKPYAERVADDVIKALEAGTAPWIKPWQPGKAPGRAWNPSTGNNYKGWNSVWLEMSKPADSDDSRWLTYKQAEKMGAQVQKGATGTVIQHWSTHKQQLMRDKDGQPVLNSHGEKRYVHIELERPQLFTAVVFHASHIEGLPPLPPTKEIPEWERHAAAEKMLAAVESPIFHDQNNRAFYSSSRDEIHLPPRPAFESPDAYYATALHEFGHSTGHASRLNRPLGNPFGSEDYAKEELRAEMFSLMLGQELGIGHDPGQHHAYIGSWIKTLKEDPAELFRAARDAQGMMDYALERVQQYEQQQSAESPVLLQPEPLPMPELSTLTLIEFLDLPEEQQQAFDWITGDNHFTPRFYQDEAGNWQDIMNPTREMWFLPIDHATDLPSGKATLEEINERAIDNSKQPPVIQLSDRYGANDFDLLIGGKRMGTFFAQEEDYQWADDQQNIQTNRADVNSQYVDQLQNWAIRQIINAVDNLEPTPPAEYTIFEVESGDAAIAKQFRNHPDAGDPEFERALTLVSNQEIRKALIGAEEIIGFPDRPGAEFRTKAMQGVQQLRQSIPSQNDTAPEIKDLPENIPPGLNEQPAYLLPAGKSQAAALSRLLKQNDIKPLSVKSQSYTEDGRVMAVRMDTTIPVDQIKQQLGKTHEILQAVAPQIQANAIIIRLSGVIMSVYEGSRGIKEQSGLTPGIITKGYFPAPVSTSTTRTEKPTIEEAIKETTPSSDIDQALASSNTAMKILMDSGEWQAPEKGWTNRLAKPNAGSSHYFQDEAKHGDKGITVSFYPNSDHQPVMGIEQYEYFGKRPIDITPTGSTVDVSTSTLFQKVITEKDTPESLIATINEVTTPQHDLLATAASPTFQVAKNLLQQGEVEDAWEKAQEDTGFPPETTKAEWIKFAYENLRGDDLNEKDISPFATAAYIQSNPTEHHILSLSNQHFEQAIERLGWQNDETGIVLACAAFAGSREEFQTMQGVAERYYAGDHTGQETRSSIKAELKPRLERSGIDIEAAINAVPPIVEEAVKRWETPLKTQAINHDGTPSDRIMVHGIRFSWDNDQELYTSKDKANPTLTLGFLNEGVKDSPQNIELDEAGMQALGQANITEIGNENIYLEKDGFNYFIKIGRTEDFEVGAYDFSQETYLRPAPLPPATLDILVLPTAGATADHRLDIEDIRLSAPLAAATKITTTLQQINKTCGGESWQLAADQITQWLQQHAQSEESPAQSNAEAVLASLQPTLQAGPIPSLSISIRSEEDDPRTVKRWNAEQMAGQDSGIIANNIADWMTSNQQLYGNNPAEQAAEQLGNWLEQHSNHPASPLTSNTLMPTANWKIQSEKIEDLLQAQHHNAAEYVHQPENGNHPFVIFAGEKEIGSFTNEASAKPVVNYINRMGAALSLYRTGRIDQNALDQTVSSTGLVINSEKLPPMQDWEGATQVRGCIEYTNTDGHTTIDEAEDSAAQFWGVYLQYPDAPTAHHSDHATRSAAELMANMLEGAHEQAMIYSREAGLQAIIETALQSDMERNDDSPTPAFAVELSEADLREQIAANSQEANEGYNSQETLDNLTQIASRYGLALELSPDPNPQGDTVISYQINGKPTGITTELLSSDGKAVTLFNNERIQGTVMTSDLEWQQQAFERAVLQHTQTQVAELTGSQQDYQAVAWPLDGDSEKYILSSRDGETEITPTLTTLPKAEAERTANYINATAAGLSLLWKGDISEQALADLTVTSVFTRYHTIGELKHAEHWVGHEVRPEREEQGEAVPAGENEPQFYGLYLTQANGVALKNSEHPTLESAQQFAEIITAAYDQATLIESQQELPSQSPVAQHPALTEKDPSSVVQPAPGNAPEKTWLAVPFAAIEQAKKSAGQLPDGTPAIGWDSTQKSWYANPGADLTKIKQYLPENVDNRQQPALSPQQEFKEALLSAGLKIEGNPIMDGRNHRVAVQGDDNSQKSGQYKGYLDGHPAGFIRNFRTDYSDSWKATGQHLSPEEQARLKAEAAKLHQQRAKETQARLEFTAGSAQDTWSSLPPAGVDNRYLASKGIDDPATLRAIGAKQDERGNLVIPLRDRSGKLWNLERKNLEFKGFEKDGKMEGCFHVIGGRSALKDQDANEPVIISTGVSTAASIHMATGKPVVVAFSDNNLKAVAEEFKQIFPQRPIAIFGDDDRHLPAKGKPNSGKEKATTAAQSVGGTAHFPRFPPETSSSKDHTDYDDLRRQQGLASVQRQVEQGLSQARSSVNARKPQEKDKDKSRSNEPALERG